MSFIKFEPLLKSVLWGGDKIIPFKNLSIEQENVGESWEISGVQGNESVVADGEYKGVTLDKLTAQLKEKLVGAENYERFGNDFPLLIKFIDAKRDLSIQVHPNDEVAHKHGKPRGKTEMWYVMESDASAKLRSGLKMKITPDEYAKMVENDTICDALSEYNVKEGDVFFLPAGRIHSIGAGCFIAEIQQTSDVTYRIYDFKRKDKNGNYRELHTEKAKEAINYEVKDNYKTEYTPKKDEAVEIASCPYFTTAVYDLTESMTLDYSELDSFVILMALNGKATLLDEDGNETTLNAGETVLLPATNGMVQVKTEQGVKFLETYI